MNTTMINGWQGGGLVALEILVLVAAVALLERTHRSPNWGRTVWQCGLVCLAVLSLAECSGWAPRLARLIWVPAPTEAVQRSPAAANLPVSPEQIEGTAFETGNGLQPPARELRSVGRAVSSRTKSSWPALRWAAFLWIGGTVLTLSYVLFARLWLGLRLSRLSDEVDLMATVRELRAVMGLRRNFRVVTLKKLTGPIAFGFRKALIAVPEGFRRDYTPTQQRAILAHELAHLRHHDPLWHLGADLLAAMWWWHPAVWWARRRFLAACETAADDAVRVLPEGASDLASSLVELGVRLRRRGAWSQMGAQGMAFRSGLGRRVERLIKLPRPTAPRRGLVSTVRYVAPGVMVVGTIVCSAWARPNTGETTMKKTTLAAASLIAALNFTEAQTSDKPDPTPPKEANSRGAQSIQRKLETVIIERVEFDSLPLGEVVKYLIHESARVDPEKRGVNFVFQTQLAQAPRAGAPAVDPATGLPVVDAEPVDLNGVSIRIMPELKNVSLIDLLDAITRVADRPISYSITDYAVVLRSRGPYMTDPRALVVTTFKIPANDFFSGVRDTFGVEIRPTPVTLLRADLKRFLTGLGVDMEDAGKSAFYNAQTGVLMVRLAPEEISIVDAAIVTVGGEGPEEKGGQASVQNTFSGSGFGVGVSGKRPPR